MENHVNLGPLPLRPTHRPLYLHNSFLPINISKNIIPLKIAFFEMFVIFDVIFWGHSGDGGNCHMGCERIIQELLKYQIRFLTGLMVA